MWENKGDTVQTVESFYGKCRGAEQSQIYLKLSVDPKHSRSMHSFWPDTKGPWQNHPDVCRAGHALDG